MDSFAQLGLAANVAIFAVAAAVVWIAGTRMAHYADAISDKTGIGQALIGLLLLAGVTSLPEIAVTASAAAAGNANLAVNNLFGSIAMQIAILAVVDIAASRRALTSILPEPTILLLCTMNVLLLTVAISGMVVGDVAVLGIGVWAWACLVGYVGCVWLLAQSHGRGAWTPSNHQQLAENARRRRDRRASNPRTPYDVMSLRDLVVRTAIAGAIILGAGYVVAQTGEALAEQTGLGSSFVGFVLVAISTSLPELSTAIGAARLGLFSMALSDIFGTNMINVGLIFLVDAVASGDPVLNTSGRFSVVGALLAIVLTTLFLMGIIERRDRTVLRMGFDSLGVILTYLGGVVLLYMLR